jgi:phage-related tail fiber protein
MANTLRIKRRASGNAGAPASLENAELAFNEIDDTLYYGKGAGGAGGTATTIEAIAGKGAVVMLSGDQSIAGVKTFSGSVNVPAPTADSHAVTKTYADTLLSNGTVANANKLTTARTIAATGDASWSVSFDGSANVSATLTLANSGVTAATYTKVTVDAKGRVTAGAALASGDLPTYTGTLTSTQVTTALGFTPYNAANPAGYTTNTGTVTSVALSLPAIFSVTGSPVTAAGTLTAALASQAANTVWAGPNGASGAPTFRALVATDIPTLTAAKISDFDTQVRTSRLDQMAAPTAAVSMNGQRLTGLAEPTSSTDAATKNYVDLSVQGLDPKQSVRAASTANIAALSGTMTIDGIALVAGDRVLLKDQTTTHQNGVYVVAAGAWTRATDMDVWSELVSAYLFVEAGTVNADMGFLCTVDPGGTLGSTAVTFVQFSGAGQISAGNGLTKTGNSLDVGAGTGITVAADTVGLTGQALALHNLATNGIFVRTGAGTVTARSVATSGTGVSVTNGDGVSGNPTVALSAALASVGGLTPAADRLPYYTGAAAAALATFTAYGRSLVDDADAATARTTLGLGTIATQNANAVAITGGSIDNITLDGGTF